MFIHSKVTINMCDFHDRYIAKELNKHTKIKIKSLEIPTY